jgi:hypothetical protein
MDAEWITMTAGEIEPGDRVRLESGEELTATHIEASFFGRADRLALIEDTPERWYKRPLAQDVTVQVQRAAGS